MAKNVFISNNLPQGSVGLIPRSYSLDYNDSDAPLSKAELISRLKGKDGLICHIISTIDDEVLAAAPTLKVVANVAVGYNNIDVAAAKRRGVIVTNTPDVLTETTADFAWALLMAAARRVVEADRYARSGQWKAWKWDLLWGADVHGKTLGIVGFGRIGRAIARRGPRRLRGGAEDPPRPGPAPECRARPAHRERLARHAHRDGHPRRPQLRGRPRGTAADHPRVLTPRFRRWRSRRDSRCAKASITPGGAPARSASSSACETVARAVGRSRRRCS